MAVGLGLGFVGYWLAYFGYCSIKGPGVGLIDLIVPGRQVTIPSSGGPGPNIGTPGTFLPSQGGGPPIYTGPTGSQFVPIPGSGGQASQEPISPVSPGYTGPTPSGGYQA